MINLSEFGVWMKNHIYLVLMDIEIMLLISNLQEIIKYGHVAKIIQ